MFDEELKQILAEASKTTQGIGRKIASPKTNPEDLLVLAEGLEYIVETLKTVRRTAYAQIDI